MIVIRYLMSVSSVTVTTLAFASVTLAQGEIQTTPRPFEGGPPAVTDQTPAELPEPASSSWNSAPVQSSPDVEVHGLDNPIVNVHELGQLSEADNEPVTDIASSDESLDTEIDESFVTEAVGETEAVEKIETVEPTEIEDLDTDGFFTEPLLDETDWEDPKTFQEVNDILDPSANPLNFPTRPEEVEIDKIQTLTLEQAIELGKRNNSDLRIARLGLENAVIEKREASAELWPTLSADITLSRDVSANLERNLSISGVSFSGAGIESTNLNGSLNFDYAVYTGGARGARLRQAERNVRLNELEVEVQTEDIRFEVTENYYNLQDADAQVAIEQASVEDATQTLRDAQLLEQAGLGTRFDVLRAEVDLANANQSLTLAIANQRSARRAMAETLNLGFGVDIVAADEIREAGRWPYSLEESIVLAYKNRAELEQELVEREIDDEQITIELADVIPTVSFFTRYNFINNFDDPVDTFDGYQVGAQVRWTFFDGGRAFAAADSSRKQIEIDENEFENFRNQIRLAVETNYYELIANQDNIDTAAKSVESATESLRLARLRFQAGVGTQTAVIDSQRDLTNARGNFLQAIIDYNQSINELIRAVTHVDIEPLSSEL